MADEKVFADGFVFKRNPNAPEFVVGRMSIKVDDAIKFMKDNQDNGWVNVQIKQSKGGQFYTELDTWKPTKGGEATQSPKQEADLPF
jgi:hypothetical protein